MKTSFKFLSLAILIAFATIIVINYKLQGEYLKGAYKKPFASYETLDFKNFDRIEVVSANAVSVDITQGPEFKVRHYKWFENTKIEQHGKTLIITFSDKGKSYYGSSLQGYLIECPFLREVKTDAVVTLNGIVQSERSGAGKSGGSQVVVKGFKQDSLLLKVDKYSTVLLRDNNFGHLNATLGLSDSSRSTVDIDGSNKILAADMNVNHTSVMNLSNIRFDSFKYKLSDSAQVNLSGLSLRLLSNNNK